jgi:ABC-2 type transport system ATP-binding protein
MENALHIDNLSKFYGKITAVNKLSFSVPKESVFGLLGPNGSGKTTTLGMILDVIEKDEGTFEWEFEHHGNVRKRIGAILESPNFYPYLSATKNLQLICKIKEIDETVIDPILKQVGLFDRKDDAFKGYSLGMKQRLAIASALLADPEVLILDEPTNGLDPKGIVDIRKLIREIASEGRTIILASHLLDEVQKVCSHFCVLNKGSLIYSGEVEALSQQKNRFLLQSKQAKQVEQILSESQFIEKWEIDDAFIAIELLENATIEDVLKELASKDLFLSHVSQQTFNLEKKFIEILDEQA